MQGNSRLDTCTAADDGASADTKVAASKGGYIGGYYGACSEQAMMEELQNGPIVVAFEATGDFFHYKEGVYEVRTQQHMHTRLLQYTQLLTICPLLECTRLQLAVLSNS